MGSWITIPVAAGTLVDPAELRCWWSRPVGPAKAGVLVLPEVFGLNGWVRRTADRLAGQGFGALAVPLFARTAPGLELGYGAGDLAEGRRHKDQVTTSQLLADLAAAAAWLRGQVTGDLGCVGFCFGGHAALLAASLPAVTASCDFYGAGVVAGRPGGGAPSLAVLPEIGGRLLCVCGSWDPLLPAAEVAMIAAALAEVDPGGRRLRLVELEGGHGFMCDERSDHAPEAAAAGWKLLLEFFEETL